MLREDIEDEASQDEGVDVLPACFSISVVVVVVDDVVVVVDDVDVFAGSNAFEDV